MAYFVSRNTPIGLFYNIVSFLSIFEVQISPWNTGGHAIVALNATAEQILWYGKSVSSDFILCDLGQTYFIHIHTATQLTYKLLFTLAP